MKRLERLSAILIYLQSKKVITAVELSERFQISVRTVYRDIASLCEAGAPIGAEAGIGYFLMEGFSLPPITFTPQEANSLLIAEKLIDGFPDKEAKNNFSQAVAKIKAALGTKEKERLETLSERTFIMNRKNREPIDFKFLDDIRDSIYENTAIEIIYTASYNNVETKRTVEPIGICFYQNNWHLLAYCRLRKDYRDFRLDRINSLLRTNEKYDINRLASIDEYFREWRSNIDLIEIRLAIQETKKKALDSSKYWYGFAGEVSENNIDVSIFFNSDIVGFAKWLLTLGSGIEIISPVELEIVRKELIEELDEYCRL